MWKQTIKFQTTIIKQEKSQIFYNSNIHRIPELKKTWLISKMVLPVSKKPVLPFLGCIQLALKKKAFIVLSKKPNITLKIQRKQPIGAKITLNKKRSLLFLYFLVFNLFPQLDWTNFLKIRNERQIFDINLSSTEIMKNLALLNNYIKVKLKMQIKLFCHPKKQTGKILWRLLKIPVK